MSEAVSSGRTSNSTRWLQLIVGIICMAMIANLQYGWTLFVLPISAKFGWSQTDIQVAFSIFILVETWLVPIEGWFVDRYGPGIVVAFGGILVAIAWSLNSVASSLPMLYLGAAIAGIGAGAVYGTCVGNALKWFPDRRGLAAGLTAAGFGAGAALTVVPIRMVIEANGYQSAFLWFGLGQGALVLILSRFLSAPKPGQVPAAVAPKVRQSSRNFAPGEILRTPAFWVLYVMFVMVAASGQVATAQLAPIAKDFKIDNVPLDIGFVTATVLTIALVVDNVLNGLARPFFGWVSDHIGREVTMAMVFTLGAVMYWALGTYGDTPWTFIIFAGLIFFTWGEIFSLFPSACTDLFGPQYAATNAGLLYTAKGTASLLVPLASILKSYTGSWHAVFVVSAIMNLVVVFAALFVLKPMREAHHTANARMRGATSRA